MNKDSYKFQMCDGYRIVPYGQFVFPNGLVIDLTVASINTGKLVLEKMEREGNVTAFEKAKFIECLEKSGLPQDDPWN